MPVCRIFLNVGSNVATRLAYSSMRNEEFPERKTDEKNEKMWDQKSSILEAFRGGNDRKFKIFFFLFSQVNLKMVFEKQNLAYLEENFLNSENLVKKLPDKNAIEFEIWQI